MLQINYKSILVLCSFLANVILGYYIYTLTKQDQLLSDEILKSQGRVEMLEIERFELIDERDSLKTVGDTLALQLLKKPKERVLIKIEKDEQIRNLVTLSIDSNLRFFARRISEVDIDR